MSLLCLAAAGLSCTSDPQPEVSTEASEAVAPPAAPVVAVAPPAAPTLAWTIEEVGPGISPRLAIGGDGAPLLAYIRPGDGGAIYSAAKGPSGWQSTTIADGVFAGFLDAAVGPDGRAHVSYYSGPLPRSQRGRWYRRSFGDTTYAVLRGPEWELQKAADRDRGAWDTSITVDSTGRPHLSAINPFSNTKGLEYMTVDQRGHWIVEPIEAGSLSWEDTSSIAIDPFGTPHITYLDPQFDSLALASRSDAGWNLDIVDEEEGTGSHSSLAIDGTGRFHVSYLGIAEGAGAVVKYGTIGLEDSRWEIHEVGALEELSPSWTGPQRLTSIAVDVDGRPWIAYTDERVVSLAHWDGASWRTETVADGAALGKMVSIALDPRGQPHVAYFEVTGVDPRAGQIGSIRYAKGSLP